MRVVSLKTVYTLPLIRNRPWNQALDNLKMLRMRHPTYVGVFNAGGIYFLDMSHRA